jgi:hypothetical protein
MDRRFMRSSCLRVVTLYIHLFLELSLLYLAPCGSSFFLAISYRYVTCTTLHAAAINPRKPDRAALRPSILNLNALALVILNATGLSLTCELPQLFLGHQMA